MNLPKGKSIEDNPERLIEATLGMIMGWDKTNALFMVSGEARHWVLFKAPQMEVQGAAGRFDLLLEIKSDGADKINRGRGFAI